MKNEKFLKKPIITIVAFLLIAGAIIYIESKKAGITNPTNIIDDNYSSTTNISLSKLGYVTPSPEIIAGKNSKYQKTPELVGIERWINSEPLKISDLKGKVVLVDFWTYSCINCIRTLPYLKSWHDKYSDLGLVIVGVHAPEFEFEKKYENVLKAVNNYNIEYPIAQDNNHATWSVFRNRYWPHKYLIDIDGYIVYDVIGEGRYEQTEKKIQELLNERMQRMNEEKINIEITSENTTNKFINTPEIYFGYQFTRGNLGNIDSAPEKVKEYNLKLGQISINTVYVSGTWKNKEDHIELIGDDGEIILVYDAKSVNIVAGSENGSNATIMLDNRYLNEKTKGSDIFFSGNKSISKVNEFKLYNLANAESYGEHFLSIKVSGKGFKIYTFTFG